MKTQNKIPTETEKYYAAKNKRREWWSENWGNFFFYPIIAVGLSAAAILIVVLLSVLFFSVGMEILKPDLIKLIKANAPATVENRTYVYEIQNSASRIVTNTLPWSYYTNDIWITNETHNLYGVPN